MHNLPICVWSAWINVDKISVDCQVCRGHGMKSFKCCCCCCCFCEWFELCFVLGVGGIPANGSIEYDVDGVAIPPNGWALAK